MVGHDYELADCHLKEGAKFCWIRREQLNSLDHRLSTHIEAVQLYDALIKLSAFFINNLYPTSTQLLRSSLSTTYAIETKILWSFLLYSLSTKIIHEAWGHIDMKITCVIIANKGKFALWANHASSAEIFLHLCIASHATTDTIACTSTGLTDRIGVRTWYENISLDQWASGKVSLLQDLIFPSRWLLVPTTEFFFSLLFWLDHSHPVSYFALCWNVQKQINFFKKK